LGPVYKVQAYLFLLLVAFSTKTQAKVEISSLRLKLSKPATAHNLVLQNTNGKQATTFFDLEPKNNERIGLFVKVNSLLLGYSLDPFKANQQTSTTHIDIVSEALDHSRIGFNLQILKGFDSKARSFETNEQERRFFPNIKSERLEFFGMHNLKTFYGKSLFNLFFLNRPRESSSVFGLSLVGDWSLRHLKLSSQNGVIYTPVFLDEQISDLVSEIRALSLSTTAGPMLSLGFKNRLSVFIESKFGLGYFKNLTKSTDLKQSGFEFLQTYGLGLSWNSKSRKTMINSRLSYQRGRHIETTFGELSLLLFF